MEMGLGYSRERNHGNPCNGECGVCKRLEYKLQDGIAAATEKNYSCE
jgi:hypothetical protein